MSFSGRFVVAERQRSREISSIDLQEVRISRISAIEPQHRAFPAMGDKRARNDKATAQTRNRCHIFGGLCHRRRSRRNGNIDSSQTRTDPAVTMVRGAPTLAAAADEACNWVCEGIVSKRLGSSYRSGRSPHWIKVKNPNAPAVKREGWKRIG